jgi:hypothetical protein
MTRKIDMDLSRLNNSLKNTAKVHETKIKSVVGTIRMVPVGTPSKKRAVKIRTVPTMAITNRLGYPPESAMTQNSHMVNKQSPRTKKKKGREPNHTTTTTRGIKKIAVRMRGRTIYPRAP